MQTEVATGLGWHKLRRFAAAAMIAIPYSVPIMTQTVENELPLSPVASMSSSFEIRADDIDRLVETSHRLKLRSLQLVDCSNHARKSGGQAAELARSASGWSRRVTLNVAGLERKESA